MDFDKSFHHAKCLFFAIYVLPKVCMVIFFMSPAWVAISFAVNLAIQHNPETTELIEQYTTMNDDYLTAQKTHAGYSYDNHYYAFCEKALNWYDADYDRRHDDDESIFTNVVKPFFWFIGLIVGAIVVAIIYKTFFMYVWYSWWRIPFLAHLVYSTCCLFYLAYYETHRLEVGYADCLFNIYHPLTFWYYTMNFINIGMIALLFFVFLMNGLGNTQEYYDEIKAERKRRRDEQQYPITSKLLGR